jgi:uncharacterized membrane protein
MNWLFPFALMEWRPHLGPLWCGLLILAAVAWVWLIRRRMLTRMDPPHARLLLAPKLLVLLLLLLALFEPVWTVETHEPTRGRLLALLDTSSSMDVADDGKSTRAARAKQALERMRKELPAGIGIETMEFDTALRETNDKARRDAVRATDLGGALVALGERKDISAFLGAVLFTDGGDDPAGNPLLPPVPLHALGFGANPETWNDVAIAAVEVPATAEKDVETEVNVDLVARTGGGGGFAAKLGRVTVLLEEERSSKWTVIATKTVSLANQRARIQFALPNKELGLRRHRVVADAQAGELSGLNNARTFAIDVQKKSLHVLYFTRELGMDFKMLRGELARDPGIAFTALFRTLSERFTLQGDRLAGDEELEAGFPTNEKTLALYECIILGSFPAEEWSAAQLAALVKYVENGGALVLLGGEKSFGRGGYAKTPLAAVMPWQISDAEGEPAAGASAVKTPPAATGHPVMSGVEDLLVRQGATLESVNPVGELKPGATALMETRAGDRGVAVVAMMPFGRGRVLGVACNTLWRWAAKGDALKTGYGLFWRQAVRHLSGKDEGGRVFTVKWDKDAYRPGEQAVAEIRVPGGSDGLRWSASVAQNDAGTPLAVEPLQGSPNAWTAKLRLRGRGDYAVKLAAFRGESAVETYEKTLRVAPLTDEGSRLELDEAFLRKLCERGSGAFFREGQVDELVKRIAANAGGGKVAMEASLAQAGPWFALLFLALLVAEWWLRRRRNLI